MSSDESDALPVLTGPLTLHRVGPDAGPGEPVGPLRAVTVTAALLDPAPDPETGEVDALPDPSRPVDVPDLPLLVVGDDPAHGRRAVPVLAVHASDQTRSLAVEVEAPVLVVEQTDDDGPTFPGRSVWCRLFPRMRGC